MIWTRLAPDCYYYQRNYFVVTGVEGEISLVSRRADGMGSLYCHKRSLANSDISVPAQMNLLNCASDRIKVNNEWIIL